MPIAGQLGVPAASGIGAAVVVLTALGTTAAQSGFATAHPGGSAVPNASNVNTNGNGDIRANLAVVPVAGDGSLSVTLERVDDVIVDVVGLLHVGERPAVGERAVHGRRADPPVRRTRAGRAGGAGRRHR